MVAISTPSVRFTEREYLALETVAETRHEYIGGDIIGMAGAELDHNQISQNVKVALGIALMGMPYRVLGSDQRVKVEGAGEYFYPDALVTCLTPNLVGPSPRSLLDPQMLIEVLSPTTEARDRGAKWSAYQTIPTLNDYVLIASDQRRLEHYQRTQDGKWTLTVMTGGACVLSNSVRLELSRLYLLTDL